jgi:RNA polymerase sigma-70 factor, ECF subfamily
MDDSLLIRQTLAGNQNAFKFLVLRYQRAIFKFLTSFRLSQPVIEDIAQETFVRAYQKLSTYDLERGASFSAWLFTIARNLALNELRSGREFTEVGSESVVENLGASQPDQQHLLEQQEREVRVRKAVDRLPEPFRKAVVLSYFGELSIQEIARIEECSLGTVKSRIFRGKQLLRSLLATEVKL